MTSLLEYSLSLIVAPANLPVTLAEAKKQCEIADSDMAHDTQLVGLIRAATRLVERDSRRRLICQTWDQTCDEWPSEEYLPIHTGPLLSISSVKYYDANGVQQTWAASNYEVDIARNRPAIWLAYGVDWPSASTRQIQNAITIRCVVGYGDVFTAVAATDLITPSRGGYANGELVQLSNYGGALPAGLMSRIDYHVRTAGTTIQLSAADPSGTVIDITGVGTGTHLIDTPPQEAKQAILMLVSHWFESREPVIVGSNSSQIELTYNALIQSINPGYYP